MEALPPPIASIPFNVGRTVQIASVYRLLLRLHAIALALRPAASSLLAGPPLGGIDAIGWLPIAELKEIGPH